MKWCGASIATLDELKVLYDGFDLTHPATSVTTTINSPAPSILAMFMNAAIDQNLDKVKADSRRLPNGLANVMYRCPPTFAGRIRATASSLNLHAIKTS